MKISARNQFAATVASVETGAVNAVVAMTCECGKTIKADITCEAVRELGLEAGKPCTVVIKASNVMFAADAELKVSARNVFRGTVTAVEKGAVNGRVSLTCCCGMVISGSITNEAIDELGLVEGARAAAFVKSTDVLVAVAE